MEKNCIQTSKKVKEGKEYENEGDGGVLSQDDEG